MIRDQKETSVINKTRYGQIKIKLEKVLQRLLFTATMMGLLPFGTKNFVLRHLNKLYFVLNATLLLIATFQLCHDLVDGSPKDITTAIDIILNAGVYFSAFVLMILYGIKVNALKDLIADAYAHLRFHSQFSEEDEVQIEPILDRLNFGLPILLVCTYASSYQWLVLPIFFSGPGGRRVLPLEMGYPYPAYDSPYYEITYALQAYLFTILGFVYSNINVTYTTTTMLVCTQFDILCCNIRNSADVDCSVENLLIPTYANLTEECIESEAKRLNQSTKQKYTYPNAEVSDVAEKKTHFAIADCVEMHQKTRKFCQNVESYFSLPLTFQFLMLVITMGCAVISFLHKFAMNTLQFTAMSVFFLAICCFQGQQILYKSGKVHEAVYLSQWIRHSTRIRKAYVILMQQGLFPSSISAGYGIFQLNLANLIAILRATFSFYTLLDKMIN